MEIISEHKITRAVRLELQKKYGTTPSVFERLRSGQWGSPYLLGSSLDFGLLLPMENIRVVLDRGPSSLFFYLHQHPDKNWRAYLLRKDILAVQYLPDAEKKEDLFIIDIHDTSGLTLRVPHHHKKSFRIYLERWKKIENGFPMKVPF
ncbi:MAG: hypothetical protein N2050_11770 [Flavobacteriales bacterium]|nr:hypothetical protein [Flavobacteriales bacterium]MCX7651213.1 hypothetical protein [Flavobacteriales bacterium]MDW8432460.1 hypothetical protein [Flavobacteriales bacterium]